MTSGKNISIFLCRDSCWFLNSSAFLLILPTSPSSVTISVLSRSCSHKNTNVPQSVSKTHVEKLGCGKTNLQRQIHPPLRLIPHRLPNLQQLLHRLPTRPRPPIHPHIMPHNLPRRPLHCLAPLAARVRLRDRRAERLCEARDDGIVVACEVIELDGFEGTVGGGGVGSGGDEDLSVEGLGGGEFEEGGEVFDYAALFIQSPQSEIGWVRGMTWENSRIYSRRA